MGRPRKADLDVVVMLDEQPHGVVVAYDDSRSNPYGVVRTDSIGRSPRGPVIWLDATDFVPTGRISRTPGRVYRKNIRHFLSDEHRGCSCQCCAHLQGYEPEPTG